MTAKSTGPTGTIPAHDDRFPSIQPGGAPWARGPFTRARRQAIAVNGIGLATVHRQLDDPGGEGGSRDGHA